MVPHFVVHAAVKVLLSKVLNGALILLLMLQLKFC